MLKSLMNMRRLKIVPIALFLLMHIDLQPPLAITKITHGDAQLKFEREGNVYWVMFETDP
jgi:hypothetical protein